MNPDQLLAHYEQIADASDAILRLRRFILDLAVRGNLVEQDPGALLAACKHVMFDDIEAGLLATPAIEEPLLHLYNRLRESGGTMLLSAERPPAQWTLRLADLRSRLAAAPAVALGAPDDRLIEAVLFKLFTDRQLRVTSEVLKFTVKRMERSFAAARRLVAQADRAALAARRDITIPLMRAILEREGSEPTEAR